MNAMDLAFVSSSIFLNWQLLSRGPRAWKFALKFPSAGEGEGYRGISTIFQLVCYAFVSITFALRCYSRSVEARNCRSDRRETWNQIGQTGKTENRNGYQIFFVKTENQMLKNGKYANRNEHENRETEVFWHKNRKTDLKNSQNRKTENPNVPSFTCGFLSFEKIII